MVHDNEADKVVEEVAKVRKFAKKISWNALDNWSWVLGSHIVGGYGDWQSGRQDGGGWQDVWGGGAGWKDRMFSWVLVRGVGKSVKFH